jgi:hypothetical protein
VVPTTVPDDKEHLVVFAPRIKAEPLVDGLFKFFAWVCAIAAAGDVLHECRLWALT